MKKGEFEIIFTFFCFVLTLFFLSMTQPPTGSVPPLGFNRPPPTFPVATSGFTNAPPPAGFPNPALSSAAPAPFASAAPPAPQPKTNNGIPVDKQPLNTTPSCTVYVSNLNEKVKLDGM